MCRGLDSWILCATRTARVDEITPPRTSSSIKFNPRRTSTDSPRQARTSARSFVTQVHRRSRQIRRQRQSSRLRRRQVRLPPAASLSRVPRSSNRADGILLSSDHPPSLERAPGHEARRCSAPPESGSPALRRVSRSGRRHPQGESPRAPTSGHAAQSRQRAYISCRVSPRISAARPKVIRDSSRARRVRRARRS